MKLKDLYDMEIQLEDEDDATYTQLCLTILCLVDDINATVTLVSTRFEEDTID